MCRYLKGILLAVSAVALVSCAGVRPPFASPEEIAVKQKLSEELAQYPGLRITVSGDRVYLEGEVLNKAELDHAIATAREIPGITSVMDTVFLIEVGSGGSDHDWD